MAVVDCVYFEAIQLVKSGQEQGRNSGKVLFKLMITLHYFLNGNSFKDVNAEVEKYFLTKDDMLTLPKERRIKVEEVEWEHLEDLHDRIICGHNENEEDK